MKHQILLSLLSMGLCFASGMAQTDEQPDMTHREYADRYIGIEELNDNKYHLWPIVEGTPGVISFFSSICNSYYIDLWYMAEAYVREQEDAELGEAAPQKCVVDPKRGYICVDFHNDGKLLVECCYWRRTNGKRLIAFNFNYDHSMDDQFFTKTHASDMIFYEYQDETQELRPILPPVEGVKSLKGARLPHEGKDITLADGRKLYWCDGTFRLNASKKATPKGAKAPELKPAETNKLSFTPEEVAAFKDEMYEDIYDILGMGCSFYCGCSTGEQTASSSLNPQGSRTYDPSNAHDLSYSTAWVEGVKGPGIGEWIEYTLPANNPRITDIHIANGIVRTAKAWNENGRVKRLEVQVNGKTHAFLNLKDECSDQRFEVPTIGYADRDHLEGKPDLVIRFIIREVYPGTKYEDTGISDIYFNGLDVH